MTGWVRVGRVVALTAAAGALAWAVSAGPATRPATASRPSSRSASASTSRASQPAYPSPKLVRATRAAAAMIARLDDTFGAEVHPPFAVIGNLPPSALRACANKTVVAPARAMWASYFRRRPAKPVTILLLADEKTYRRWAKKLFNDTAVSKFGYYRPSDRTMVMNIATGGGTLVHELTHALIVWDFPSVPDWFNEGLASLHEQCSVGAKRITGHANWRLPALQKAVRARRVRPLRELLVRDDFYGRLRGTNYAQARYFVMYMQHRGLLEKFYRRFRTASAGPAAGAGRAETPKRIAPHATIPSPSTATHARVGPWASHRPTWASRSSRGAGGLPAWARRRAGTDGDAGTSVGICS